MTCDPRRLSYYRDGALSYEERFELEAHMRDCAQCVATLRRLMRLAQVVRSLPMEPASPSLRQDVRRLLAERQQERAVRRRSLAGIGKLVAPAAVAAAIAVSSIAMIRPAALPTPVSAVPSAALADAPTARPGVAQGGPTTSSPSGVQAAAGGSSLVSKPALHLPVVDAGAGSLPTKLASPAQTPEAIARLYAGNSQVRKLLGESYPGSRTVTLLEQSFQGGLAIWRSDTRQIYVLQREGQTWSVHDDTWRPGDRIVAEPTPPPPGAMVPAGGFATVWRSTPEIKNRLGWAVYEPRGSGGSIQTYERGLIVWTPHGLLYVLSNDGRWRTFPDASPL